MSHTKTAYDACNYRQSLREAVAPGMYFLGTPLPVRDKCDGPGGIRTDAGSELLGLQRKESRCGSDKYGGRGPGGLHCAPPAALSERAAHLHAEDTRVSNPPSTLRGNGVNRWTPLCEDPTDFAIEPFPHVPMNDRRSAKDSHEPRFISPLPVEGVLPPSGAPQEVSPEDVEAFPPVPMLPDFNACEARVESVARSYY